MVLCGKLSRLLSPFERTLTQHLVSYCIVQTVCSRCTINLIQLMLLMMIMMMMMVMMMMVVVVVVMVMVGGDDVDDAADDDDDGGGDW